MLLRKQSKDPKLTLQERFIFGERARRLSLELGIDSTIVKSNLNVSGLYYRKKDFNLFKQINKETLSLATKIKDSSSIAELNFNLGAYFQVNLENDSAYYYYYNSEKIYYKTGDLLNAGRVLLNMAVIQKNEKDFIGSENTCIRAIPYLESVIDTLKVAYRPLASIHNNLAIISKELGQYDKAIKYYNKAIELQRKQETPKKRTELSYTNNLALVYEESGDYQVALDYFSNLLNEKEIMAKDSTFYARVLDNFARNKFLIDKNDNELPGLYLEALAIRERIGDKGGIMQSNMDLGEYYLGVNQLEAAKIHASIAYDIAKKYNRHDDELEVLLMLSEIEKGDTALTFTQEYIALNDSLNKAERAIRNKFARIEYETDRIEEQNVKFSRERELFLTLAIAGLIGAILIYIIISQRSRNNELRFNQEQQKANEEIYNLMLSQQDKMEEGRTKEKQRISEDLHDGILGRLFGTRLSLDSLNMSSDEDAVKNREQYIEELKSIEQEIRRISHDLNADFVGGSGYLDIVKTMIETQTEAYKLSYNFIHKDEIDWEGVSNKTKIHFYRMIQESLQNIYKHANAKHVDISFEMKGHQIYLNIEDDGEGFVVNKAKKGIGLKNIKSRVEELKGELFINSQIDAGTRISISVPL
jgi:signal transduction histidine kinase